MAVVNVIIFWGNLEILDFVLKWHHKIGDIELVNNFGVYFSFKNSIVMQFCAGSSIRTNFCGFLTFGESRFPLAAPLVYV